MRLLIIILVVLGIGYSCNPVKQVLKDPGKLNEIADELVRQGLCTNDTTIVTNISDTVYVTDESQYDTIFIDSPTSFDTVLQSGTRIKYQNGLLTIKEKVVTKTRVVTKQVDNYIKDNKLENLLKQDIQQLKDSLNFHYGLVEGYEKQIDYLNGKINKTRWLLIAVIGLILFRFVWKVGKTFRPL